jgi:hypothetical protein
MNRFIIFHIVIITLLMVGSLSEFISWDRVGQVFLAIAIYDFILSIAGWRGWPILRGDISSNAPLSKQDSGEAIRNEYLLEEHPYIGFVKKVAGAGILAFGVGVILLVFSSYLRGTG